MKCTTYSKRSLKISKYLPVCLSLDGKKCVVLGGGKVALRKIKVLLDFGASVKVISPNFTKEIKRLSKEGKIDIEKREYRDGDLRGAYIAFCAVGKDNVIKQIKDEAKRENVLVNFSDKVEFCDFILPSYIKRKDLVISISSSGKSPALCKAIREVLEDIFKDGEMVEVLAKRRKSIKMEDRIKEAKKLLKEELYKILETF